MPRYGLAAGVCALMTLAAAGMASAPPEMPPPDYQRRADGTRWQWSDDDATLDDSLRRFRADGFRLEVRAPADAPARELRVLADEGREVIRLAVHGATVFRAVGRTLFVAAFDPERTGCAVEAYDLDTGRQFWRTPLRGLGPLRHLGYTNRVVLNADRGVLTILGRETAGRYVEVLDATSGRTVGHRRFADEE